MTMHGRPFQLVLIGILALSLCSCSGKKDYGTETFPVTGEVHVDGQPAGMLSVTLNRVEGMDPNVQAIPSAVTKEDGTFSVSTFEAGDGAPVGEYTATFAWGEMQGLSINTDKDKLKGRYSDPKKSEHTVTVVEGQPTDLGKIDLKTKK